MRALTRQINPFGELSIRVDRGLPSREASREANAWRWRNLRYLHRGVVKLWLAQRILNVHTVFGSLYLTKIDEAGRELDLGLAGFKVVTDNGVAFIVDGFQDIVELEIMKYHGIGTGTTAENVTDSALETELTTQYQTDNTRATGTTAEGATANIYRTVATNTVDATVAITEHGILTQAATGGGVLLDRTVFAAVNLVSGESLQTTYDLTLTAGS